ncbi:hypothetical protein HG531_009698 [Fusarium graminearum]|nr:hypothetical protein HG531_009698 [Fusarium graminearum]
MSRESQTTELPHAYDMARSTEESKSIVSIVNRAPENPLTAVLTALTLMLSSGIKVIGGNLCSLRFAKIADAATDTWKHAFQGCHHFFRSGFSVVLTTAVIGFPEFPGHILKLFLKLGSLLVGSNSLRRCSAFVDACKFCLNLVDSCCNAVDLPFQVVHSNLVSLSLSIKLFKLGLVGTCSGHSLGAKSAVFSTVLIADFATLLLHLFLVVVLEYLTSLLHAFDTLLDLLDNLNLFVMFLGDLGNLDLERLDLLSGFVDLLFNWDETVLFIFDVSHFGLDILVNHGHLAVRGSLLPSGSIKPLLK